MLPVTNSNRPAKSPHQASLPPVYSVGYLRIVDSPANPSRKAAIAMTAPQAPTPPESLYLSRTEIRATATNGRLRNANTTDMMADRQIALYGANSGSEWATKEVSLVVLIDVGQASRLAHQFRRQAGRLPQIIWPRRGAPTIGLRTGPDLLTTIRPKWPKGSRGQSEFCGLLPPLRRLD